MLIIDLLLKIINALYFILSNAYKLSHLYEIVGIFATRKFKTTQKFNKYAVLIAARNEETVIGNLIDSIKKQDYPSELVTVFVVADNCTDKTALIARQAGARVYERFDSKHKTKGFALQFLVSKIKEDYGDVSYFDGYFIFDADNLLKSDFITRMNESFSAGEKIVTSYRNSKNFDSNWISASYSLHWLRTVRTEHRPRSLFHLATRIQGTGFLFSWELIKDGWNYTSFTEDRAFCADAVVKGYKISYNNEAIFYDEQPIDFKIAMRQRIRWAKGHIQALFECGGKLFLHIFYTGGAANRDVPKETTRCKRFINNIRLRLMSFDILTITFPAVFWNTGWKLVSIALKYLILWSAGSYVTKEYIFPTTSKGDESDIISLLLNLAIVILSGYLFKVLTAIYVFILESKRMIKMKWHKKLWFAITFPLFDVIAIVSTVVALVTRVEWKPIPHKEAVTIEDLKEKSTV